MIKPQAWKRAQHPTWIVSCLSNQVWVRSDNPIWVPQKAKTAALTANAVGILGENGVARFREFWAYQDGWDFGQGQALTAPSVSRMERFLSSYSYFPRRPSLFLSLQGNLVLGWEDAAGEPIEVEFTAKAYVLFLGVEDSERTFLDGELADLLRLLPAAEAHAKT